MKFSHKYLIKEIRRSLAKKLTFNDVERHLGSIAWLKSEYPDNQDVQHLEKRLKSKIAHLKGAKK